MAFISGSRLSQRGSPAKISLYRLKTTVEGKLYISSELVEVLGASSRATLEFRGRLYSVSAYRPSKQSKGLKLYLPREVVERVLESGAEGAVIEVEEGRVHLIRLIRFCRICKRPTTAPDGICMAQHFHEDGVCRRCGEAIRKGVLCDHCVKIYAQLCGLGSWLDPETETTLLVAPRLAVKSVEDRNRL